ncbi:MAG TPA: ATP-binding protein [Caulobacteraceae bacterium]|nr:ATP-binding protein [Caulobacteraceae bacterium]
MADRTDTLQDRVKTLGAVRTRSRRWPLWALAAVFAAAVAAAFAWDSGARAGAPPPWALLALASVLVVAGVVAGHAFVTLKDRLTRNFLELATRRVAEFEESGDATFILNLDGGIEAANAAAEHMLGRPRSAFLRMPILDIMDIAPDGDAPFLARLEGANGALGAAPVREVVARRFDGGEAPVDVTLRSMHMADGRFIAVYARDISDRKRVERLKDEFVSTVSHELRTPLTSIAGSLGLLMGGATAPLPEGPARLIAIAHANCQRLVRLINDILDVEKIESGKMNFDMAPLTMAQVAERSIDAVRGYADQLGVTLVLDAEGDALAIRGDLDRLVQVGANLISNAIKFSKTGDQVTITARRWGRLARITVEDHGPGIPEEFRARMFTKFAQADSSDTRQRGGTGLGLVIAKEITERHGGRLWFDSTPGVGTKFYIDLPLSEALEAGGESDGLGRLLVCEDDPDAALVLKQTLERDGFVVDVVGAAAEAQAALGVHNNYRALVLDLVLPDRHGLALIQALRQAPATRELPVIVVSAQAELGRAQGAALDVIDWMEKPIDVVRLRRAVATALGRTPTVRPTILHVDDDPDILEVTATALAGAGEVVSVESLAAARAFLAARTPNLVILDLALGDGSGLSLLPELNDAKGLPIPVLIFSAHDTDSSVLSRVAAVLTKSRTTLPNLAEAVRRLVDKPPPAAAKRRIAS